MGGAIQVSEERGVRYLHFGSHWVQGAMRMSRPYALELEYTREMMLPLLLRRDGAAAEVGWKAPIGVSVTIGATAEVLAWVAEPGPGRVGRLVLMVGTARVAVAASVAVGEGVRAAAWAALAGDSSPVKTE